MSRWRQENRGVLLKRRDWQGLENDRLWWVREKEELGIIGWWASWVVLPVNVLKGQWPGESCKCLAIQVITTLTLVMILSLRGIWDTTGRCLTDVELTDFLTYRYTWFIFWSHIWSNIFVFSEYVLWIFNKNVVLEGNLVPFLPWLLATHLIFLNLSSLSLNTRITREAHL